MALSIEKGGDNKIAFTVKNFVSGGLRAKLASYFGFCSQVGRGNVLLGRHEVKDHVDYEGDARIS
eukprot:638838-Pleurochrysis_carterae.AAC.3